MVKKRHEHCFSEIFDETRLSVRSTKKRPSLFIVCVPLFAVLCFVNRHATEI